MQEIVINDCYGGFSLSTVGLLWLRVHGSEYAINSAELIGEVRSDGSIIAKNYFIPDFHLLDIPRNDALLVQCIKELGENANGTHADLKIVKIPDDVEWQIEEYDGLEYVAERHRTWR